MGLDESALSELPSPNCSTRSALVMVSIWSVSRSAWRSRS